MLRKQIQVFVLVLACAQLWAVGCSEDSAETDRSSASSSTPVEPCIEVDWLGTPAFLYDVSQASQTGACQFHQFSWQNYFYLTTPEAGPRFEHMSPIQEVFRATGEASCEDVHPLGSQLTFVVKSDVQASNDSLIDQNGRYVHFTIRINPEECEFINRHRLYTSACYDEAVSQRLELPSGTASSAGALEIKAAWRTLETCDLPDSGPPEQCRKDDLGRYLTAGATVQPLSPEYEGAVEVTLGLVGFHFIQKTPDHPEFIWASFEHVDNDPVCEGAQNEICRAPDTEPAGGWSFNDPDCQDCAVNSASAEQPAQVCRVNPCGVDWSNEDNARVNAEAIRQLNDSVHRVLRERGSPLANYRLIGTLWTKKGSTIPEQEPYDFTDIETGSTLLANTTLETFDQNIGCFVCHNNSAVPYSPPEPDKGASTQLNFSFVFSRILQQTEECPGAAGAGTEEAVASIRLPPPLH